MYTEENKTIIIIIIIIFCNQLFLRFWLLDEENKFNIFPNKRFVL